jgi:hypothetical protein
MIYKDNYFFGAPWSADERQKFENAILKRYNNDSEKALGYVSNELLIQLSKSSGILGSSSLLAGISYFLGAPFAVIISLLTILISISSFYSHWPKEVWVVEDPLHDFKMAFRLACNRSIQNSISTVLIIINVIYLLSIFLLKNFI